MFPPYASLKPTEIFIQKNNTCMTYINRFTFSRIPISGSDSDVGYVFAERRNSEPILEDLPNKTFQYNWIELAKRQLYI